MTYDHTDTGKRTGVGTRKKTQDLSACESEEHGHGLFLVCMLLMAKRREPLIFFLHFFFCFFPGKINEHVDHRDHSGSGGGSKA